MIWQVVNDTYRILCAFVVVFVMLNTRSQPHWFDYSMPLYNSFYLSIYFYLFNYIKNAYSKS